VDPTYGLVAVYFSVHSKGGIPVGVAQDPNSGLAWRLDLFINAAMAAVLD
jgi:hypothetical protein